MIINTIKELRKIIKSEKSNGKSIGFVPTMGFLHEGHISLIKKAKEENDFVIVSVFVNPIQFGPNEDFERYPRNIEKDIKLAFEAGCNVVFNPEVEEMFPDKVLKTKVLVEGLTNPLCGRSRPSHFQGVTTIVTKLFNIVAPNNAYFGQKDAQQAAVLMKMVRDLNFDLKVVMCPIVREKDGLALSSRNVYLNPQERKEALVLSKSLFLAEDLIKSGEKNPNIIIKDMTKKIKTSPLGEIEYIEILDFRTLKEVSKISGKILIALAVKFGTTRLIDNIIMEVK